MDSFLCLNTPGSSSSSSSLSLVLLLLVEIAGPFKTVWPHSCKPIYATSPLQVCEAAILPVPGPFPHDRSKQRTKAKQA